MIFKTHDVPQKDSPCRCDVRCAQKEFRVNPLLLRFVLKSRKFRWAEDTHPPKICQVFQPSSVWSVIRRGRQSLPGAGTRQQTLGAKFCNPSSWWLQNSNQGQPLARLSARFDILIQITSLRRQQIRNSLLPARAKVNTRSTFWGGSQAPDLRRELLTHRPVDTDVFSPIKRAHGMVGGVRV